MELRLTPPLTERFGRLDNNKNGTLSYDELRYQSNEMVITALNIAVQNDTKNAVDFFKSLPIIRIANLFFESQIVRPLDQRFLYSLHNSKDTFVLGIVETLLESGLTTHGHSLQNIADWVLLAASDPMNVQQLLLQIHDKPYTSTRLLPNMTSSLTVLPSEFRKDVVNGICDSDTFLIARQKIVNEGGAIQEDIHLEASYQLTSKVFSENASYDDFKRLKEFVDNLYLEDPQFITLLYKSGDGSIKRGLEIFLSDIQVNDLLQNYSDKEIAELHKKRALLPGVIDVNTKDELDALISNGSTPLLVDFGFLGCSPCQRIQEDLPYTARLFSGKMSIVHADIELEGLAAAADAHKKHCKNPGFPDVGIYANGKYLTDIYSIQWGWDTIRNVIKNFHKKGHK